MTQANETESKEKIYASDREEAESFIEMIRSSDARNKVVAAGPGTGKTHLFKQISSDKNSVLVLTFINALVEDLHIQLPDFVSVRTLHGYARSLLTRAGKETIVFNNLEPIIRDDAKLLSVEDKDYASLIRNMRDDKELAFYKERKKYYGNYYGYDDLIYEAVSLLKTDDQYLEMFDVILVDEFQDLNNLEVAFVDELARKSPVLIAGDDDQSLYGFRDSTYDHIRERYSEDNAEFESFNLPFCFRCPEIIVNAVNAVLEFAKAKGLLDDRIEKSYKYFHSEDKDKVSTKFPKIAFVERQRNAIYPFIKTELEKIVKAESGAFDVLIITPFSATGFKKKLVRMMIKDGFLNVGPVERGLSGPLIEGLSLILETGQQYSNLGWRIVSQRVLDEKTFKSTLNESLSSTKPFYKLLESDVRSRIRKSVGILRKLNEATSISDEEREEIWDFLGLDISEIVNSSVVESLRDLQHSGLHVGIRSIPIKVTNILKSKGLSADYVFITHLDNRFFLEDGKSITEKDIFNFIVALSRTKKKAFLMSMPDNTSTFVNLLRSKL